VLAFAANGSQLTFTGGPFGGFVYLRADVAGVSGHGTPVGGVTFSDTFGPIPDGGVYQLNAGDQLNSGSNTATPNGILNFDTGTHTISASYSGDGSFDASSTITSQTFTITAGFYPTNPTPSTVLISAPGVSGLTSFSVSSSTGFSGTIALSCSGLPATAASNSVHHLWQPPVRRQRYRPRSLLPPWHLEWQRCNRLRLRIHRLGSAWLALRSFLFCWSVSGENTALFNFFWRC
jgi:hypothetical protein